MKKNEWIKWVDVQIEDNIFTVRCDRYDDFCGVIVSFSVYELHKHPTNFLKRFIEFWKYKQFGSGKWIEAFSTESLQKCIADTCMDIVKSNEKHFEALKEWENL